MGIIDRLITRAIDQYIKAQGGESPPGFLVDTADNERHNIPDSSIKTNQLELQSKVSWVADAVGYPSRFAASMPIEVFERHGEDVEEIKNHPFEILLQQPNPNQSTFTLKEGTFSNLLLTGDAYWFLNKTSENEPPMEIYNLPPDRVRPIAEGTVDIVAGYEWDAGKGESIFLEEWEVVHFREYNARNMFVGLSRVESIGKEANTEIAAAEYDLNFYGRDFAKPEGLLSFKGRMEDPQWEALQKRFTRKHGNTKRSLAMVQGPDTVDYTQLVYNYTDMDFLNNRTFKKEMIYNHFAPGLASILAVNATEANARQGKQTLLEFGIWPMLVNIHEQITNKIMNSYGEGLIARFHDPRQVDRELELSELTAMSQTHTVDEIRQSFWNIEPLEDERGGMLPIEVTSGMGGTATIETPGGEATVGNLGNTRANDLWKDGIITLNQALLLLGLPTLSNGEIYNVSGANIQVPSADIGSIFAKPSYLPYANPSVTIQQAAELAAGTSITSPPAPEPETNLVSELPAETAVEGAEEVAEETTNDIPPQFADDDEEDEEKSNRLVIGIKAIGDIEQAFAKDVDSLVRQARDDKLTRRQFNSKMRAAVARGAKNAYREGLIAGGIENGELSDEDNRIIVSFIKEQQSLIPALSAQIYSKDGISTEQAIAKSTLWYSKSIEPAFQKGLLSADANGMYEWQLGTTEEHCRDCLRLDGQRHRMKDWASSGWLPRSDRLECHGFHCDCVLIPASGKARGRLGKAQLLVDEIAAWKSFVKKRANRGELFADMKDFEVHYIDDETAEAIRGKLAQATNGDELKAVFREDE